MPYSPHTDEDRNYMLSAVGCRSAEELFNSVPRSLKGFDWKIPGPLAEQEVKREMNRLSGLNKGAECLSFLGAGAYEHYLPSVVDHVIRRPEFFTSYTPYQPEVSQGNLQVIYEYQSLICHLTGLEVSQASLYDGGSATAEAAFLMKNCQRKPVILVSRAVHPLYREVLKTYCQASGTVIHELPLNPNGATENALPDDVAAGEVAGVIVQQPNFLGVLEDLESVANWARDGGFMSAAVINPIAVSLLKPPGDCGIDIAVGEGQPLGIPLSYGGPYLGFIAATKKQMRKMPGRISGRTKDLDGKRGFVLALQTREQHIRREQATSNICTNQALCALAASVYLVWYGPRGLRELALLNARRAHYACAELLAGGVVDKRFKSPFFNEFTVKVKGGAAEELLEYLLGRNIVGGLHLGRFYPEYEDCILVAVTETRGKRDIDSLAAEVKSWR